MLHYGPFTPLSDTLSSKVNLLMLKLSSKGFCALNTPMRFVYYMDFQVLIRVGPALKAVHPHKTQRVLPICKLSDIQSELNSDQRLYHLHFIQFLFCVDSQMIGKV